MSSTSQQFPEFYRKHGVLRLDSLTDPEPTLVKHLPVDSAVHYLGVQENPEIDTSDSFLKGYTERIRYMDITQHDPAHNEGVLSVKNITRDQALFRKKNRNFELVRDFKQLKSTTVRQLMVFNYGYIDIMYRYPSDRAAQFKRFEDKLWTLVHTIEQVQQIEPRHHFIFLSIPTQLVAKSVLDNQAMAVPNRLAVFFPGEDEQILRHIWMFLNPELKANSVWSGLSEDTLRKVNLVFRGYDGKVTVLNLGYLYSWVLGNANLTLNNSVTQKSFVDVQKYYLRSMMTIREIELRGAALAEQLTAEQEQKKIIEQADDLADMDLEEVSEEDQRFLEESEELRDSIRFQNELTGKSKDASDFGSSQQKADPKETDLEAVSLSVDESEIDKDIQALEQIQTERMNQLQKTADELKVKDDTKYSSDIAVTAEEVGKQLLAYHTPEQAVMSKLSKLAAEGAVPSSEFRKKEALLKQAQNLKDPYDSGLSLKQAAMVTKKDLEITDEDVTLNVPATVIDKSMARSSLSVINRKYTQTVLKKDILSSIQYLQKSGVIVKNHQVDQISTATGEYDVHTLEFVPINGQPSVIRQRIPRVNEDGTFVCKSVKYALRKQTYDLPIRKIGEHRVGLSSYYGKINVDRATKVANSSLSAVIQRLNKATVTTDPYLKEVTPGKVFDNYFKAPYIYSGISEHFMSFTAGDINFDFNHKRLRSTIDPVILAKLEANGRVVCGSQAPDVYITVDQDEMFHAVSPKTSTPIGNIYTVLQMDESRIPVDYAELTIFSNSIAVGFYLAQQIGFRKLVKFLGAKHRLVYGKERKNLQPYEYVVQFRDVSYIFDRRQKQASLVLAGFSQFEKEIKLYDAELFDLKDVYTKVLDSKGLRTSIVAEMQNLQDLFVDPITERILKDMNEPITFNGLLLRSCELLQTYYYPDSQDSDYQRVRGYDRFAGFFYREMVNSIRAFKYKNRSGRAKIDASPFALWTTITRDSAVKNAEDINPIQDLKISQEAVTYVGEGGRSKLAMNKESRAYVKSNIGIYSEAGVDSSDVGINCFLSVDAGLKTIDGVSDPDRRTNSTNKLSTAALLAPFSTYDD